MAIAPPPGYAARDGRLSLAALHITFRVAEPAGLARRLPPLANGVTDQGLGVVTSAARNKAGNPVLADVKSFFPHYC